MMYGLTQFDTGCFIAVPIWQQWASKGYGRWHFILNKEVQLSLTNLCDAHVNIALFQYKLHNLCF